MKNIIITLSFLFANLAIGQTHQITKHNGEQLDVNFIKQENDLIYYSLDGSRVEQKISKYAVSQLTNKETKEIKKMNIFEFFYFLCIFYVYEYYAYACLCH